jgi:hypothetical protein
MASNGRIDINIANNMNPFKLYDKKANSTSSFRDALTGNWENTPLSDLFFCKDNIDLLNNSMRKAIYDKSHGLYLIGQQSQDELKIIMRAIYLQSALNLDTNITEQIGGLNKLVLAYCIPQIYGEIQGYIKYTKDVSTMYTPMDRPVLSNTNDKTLELKPWF